MENPFFAAMEVRVHEAAVVADRGDQTRTLRRAQEVERNRLLDASAL